MKKRLLISFVIVIILTLLFSGWSFFKKRKQKTSDGPTTVVFYLWDDPSFAPIIEKYNKSQNEVFVDAKFMPTNGYEEKITILLAGGTKMDGYMQKRSTDVFAQYDNGYIEPLDDLIKKARFNMKPLEGYKGAITIDGKTVAIPFRGASYFTYYNKKLFEKAGVPTPDTYVKKGQWTWDKFIEVSEEVHSKLPDIYGGFLYTWGSNNVMPALQSGIKFIDKNGNIDIDDSLINSYKYRLELEKSGAIMPLIETKVTKTHYSKPFYAGKAAMLVIGEWFPGFMKKGRDENLLEGYTWDDWALTRMPCDEKTYTTFGNPTFSHVHSGSKNKEAMFKFISWMGGPEGAKIVAANGVLPAYVTNDVKKEFSSILPDDSSVKYYGESRKVNTQFYNKYGSKVEGELGTIMEEYLLKPVSDSELKSMIEARLKKVKEQIK